MYNTVLSYISEYFHVFFAASAHAIYSNRWNQYRSPKLLLNIFSTSYILSYLVYYGFRCFLMELFVYGISVGE